MRPMPRRGSGLQFQLHKTRKLLTSVLIKKNERTWNKKKRKSKKNQNQELYQKKENNI